MNDLLKIWAEKIRANDVNQVVELYHNNAILLGTFSNIERKGKDLIFNYFKNLFKKSIDVEIITNHEYLTDSITVNTGLYNFIINDKKIKARFSFVFVKTIESWEIISHHSSELPETIKR
tara:strand:+ start:568 stop:927 length:360 start_codon:yes stop_codon:yes gene_type:complete